MSSESEEEPTSFHDLSGLMTGETDKEEDKVKIIISERFIWLSSQLPILIRPDVVDCSLEECAEITWVSKNLKKIEVVYPREDGKPYRKVAVAFNAMMREFKEDPNIQIPVKPDEYNKSDFRNPNFWQDVECYVKGKITDEDDDDEKNPKTWVSIKKVIPEQIRSKWNTVENDKNDVPPPRDNGIKTKSPRGRKKRKLDAIMDDKIEKLRRRNEIESDFVDNPNYLEKIASLEDNLKITNDNLRKLHTSMKLFLKKVNK